MEALCAIASISPIEAVKALEHGVSPSQISALKLQGSISTKALGCVKNSGG
jgi:hypothetical protein